MFRTNDLGSLVARMNISGVESFPISASAVSADALTPQNGSDDADPASAALIAGSVPYSGSDLAAVILSATSDA